MKTFLQSKKVHGKIWLLVVDNEIFELCFSANRNLFRRPVWNDHGSDRILKERLFKWNKIECKWRPCCSHRHTLEHEQTLSLNILFFRREKLCRMKGNRNEEQGNRRKSMPDEEEQGKIRVGRTRRRHNVTLPNECDFCLIAFSFFLHRNFSNSMLPAFVLVLLVKFQHHFVSFDWEPSKEFSKFEWQNRMRNTMELFFFFFYKRYQFKTIQ